MKLWEKVSIFMLCIVASTVFAAAAEPADVPLDRTAFPDPAFLQWSQQKDTDGDGFLSQSELDAVTSIDLRKRGIQDLTGLEHFHALKTLNCSENDLTSLVLPDFPFLTSLTCNENPQLATLDLHGAPALQHLYCFHSNLSQLDLHALSDLAYFVWGGSPLQELDLSGNPNLHTLHILGGDISCIDLSHNEKLDTLLLNHTRIETLDLSHQAELTYLNCTDNQLTALDLSGNQRLETIYAGNNRLLAIRMPSTAVSFCDLSGQRPAAYALASGENGFSLQSLIPWIESDNISQFIGADLQDDWVSLSSPNQTITYHYTDGAAILEASITVTGENSWKIPLHITDWTYGQPAAQPQAQPTFGSAVFDYAPSAEGPFQQEPPATAGTWYVRATVAETPQYPELTAIASFQIHPAVPEYPIPETKLATYGDLLSSVPLEPRFSWENNSLSVGDAGTQTHYTIYQPEDMIDYQVVGHIPVQIQVSPYDGTRLFIPEISSRAEAENLVITHGAQELQEGKDYVTQFTTENDMTQFHIHFQGNYTGTVTRSFSKNIGGGTSGGGSHSFTITAAATTGGNITPSGRISVRRGQDQSFVMQADDGYRLENVLIDGTPIGASGTYQFQNVTQNHTIAAIFTPLHQFPTPDETGVSAYLDTLSHQAFLSGYPNNRFGPDEPLTRAQAAQLFYNLLKNQDVPAPARFADVPDDAWYAKAVNTLAALGKIYGTEENQFSPNREITRAEFVTMAMRFASPAANTAQTFPDVQPNDWFYDTVMSATAYGWINGNPDGTFAPYALVTRAQAAAILNRMLDRHADQTFIDTHTDLRIFEDVPASHWAYFDICEAANPHDYEKKGDTEIWTELL